MTIKPTSSGPYAIYKALLSARGYVVIQTRSYPEANSSDIIVVYSINGELIAETKFHENINAILFDPTQYFIVILI